MIKRFAVSRQVQSLFIRLAATLLMLPLIAEAESLPPELPLFRYVRVAELPENTLRSGHDTAAVTLDSFFYSQLDDLANSVRIVDRSGRLVPFVLQKASNGGAIHSQQQLSGKIVRSQQLPDGSNAIEFELADGAALISCVELVGGNISPGAKLSMAVGSVQNLQVVLDKLPLADITKLPGNINRRFPLTVPAKGRMLRLTLSGGSFEGLEALRVYTSKVQQQSESAITLKYDLPEVSRKVYADRTEIIFNANHVPLTRLQIESAARLYLRQVIVQSSNDRRKWQLTAHGSIRKIDLDIADSVDFAEVRCKYLQITIPHRDAEHALNDVKVTAYGNVYQWLVKLHDSGRMDKLFIYYGAVSPLPQMSFQLSGSDGTPAEYIMSAPGVNPLRKAGVRDLRTWQHLSGAVVVLLGGLVIIYVFIALGRSKQVLPED